MPHKIFDSFVSNFQTIITGEPVTALTVEEAVPHIDGIPRIDLVDLNYDEVLAAGYQQHIVTGETSVPRLTLKPMKRRVFITQQQDGC